VFSYVNDGKLARRVVKCMFLGYAFEFKRYRMWCLDSKKFIQSREVTFNENTRLSSGKESTVSSIGTGDREDASRTMETDAETVTAQSGAADHSSRRFRLLNPVLVLINLRWRMIIP